MNCLFAGNLSEILSTICAGNLSELTLRRYLEPLAVALDKEKWTLVQFLLSSSYSGYGISSLKEVSTLFLDHDLLLILYSLFYICLNIKYYICDLDI